MSSYYFATSNISTTSKRLFTVAHNFYDSYSNVNITRVTVPISVFHKGGQLLFRLSFNHFILSDLEFILFELQQVWMVGAEQECAAVGVGVGVGDFLRAATLAPGWDGHFECLRRHIHVESQTITYHTHVL